MGEKILFSLIIFLQNTILFSMQSHYVLLNSFLPPPLSFFCVHSICLCRFDFFTYRSSSTPPSGQQSSTPPTATSISPAPPSTQGSTTTASGQSLPVPHSQQQQQQAQGQGQMPGSAQQQQQMKAQLKAMKLAPSSKPQGIDPTVIIKEREHRYVLAL